MLEGHGGKEPDVQTSCSPCRLVALHHYGSTAWTDAVPEAAAVKAADALDLPEAKAFLTEIPMRGSPGVAVPTDPTIYRFYEIVQVYGTTLKALVHEEFGDGIMSAIDFDLDLSRQPDPNGDRVKIVMSGKFLKYKKD